MLVVNEDCSTRFELEEKLFDFIFQYMDARMACSPLPCHLLKHRQFELVKLLQMKLPEMVSKQYIYIYINISGLAPSSYKLGLRYQVDMSQA